MHILAALADVRATYKRSFGTRKGDQLGVGLVVSMPLNEPEKKEQFLRVENRSSQHFALYDFSGSKLKCVDSGHPHNDGSEKV